MIPRADAPLRTLVANPHFGLPRESSNASSSFFLAMLLGVGLLWPLLLGGVPFLVAAGPGLATCNC
jgi:hypothetical protein